MAVIRGGLGNDERGGTGQRDGRGVLWGDDILNGLDEDNRFDGDDDGRSEGDGRDDLGRLYFSAVAPDDDRDDAAKEAGEALSLAELLDDGALPVDGPAGAQPVTLDAATAIPTGPSVEDLVATPENGVA